MLPIRPTSFPTLNAASNRPEVSFDQRLFQWAVAAPASNDRAVEHAALLLTAARYRELSTLDLSGLALRSIPDVFERLPWLEQLDLRSNSLRELPTSMGTLDKLVTLDLSQCCFRDIPDACSTMTALQTLNLAGNRLDGNGLAEAAFPSLLSHLDLRDNQIECADKLSALLARCPADCVVEVEGNIFTRNAFNPLQHGIRARS
jgi:Leucine-rich repeat (LRR) protein